MDPTKLCMGCMEDDSGEPVCPKCGSAFNLPPKNSLQLKPRTMLRDQYLVGRALGHGGFGITYLAWDVGLEAKLAVKEYMPNGVAGRASGDTKVLAYSDQTKPEFDWGLDRFLDEARTLKKFSKYPGIVSVDTIFRDNGTAYLVMEYLDGWTFEDFVKRRGGKIAWETALRIMLPVLDALAAVHAEGILHRDISPDNIYLTRAGKVKLIDFGAARNALGQKSRNLSIILKEGYAPEEQYRASGIQGPWTDVYATAATLYHAVTGKIPQPALDRQAEDKVQSPSALGVEVDRRGEAALMKALSVRAGDRFQSMEDFKTALTATSDAPPVYPHVDPPAPPQPPPPPSVLIPPPPSAQLVRPPSGHLPSPPSMEMRPPSAHLQPPLSGQFIPPPPPVPAKPRWIWPAALGAIAILAIAAALMRPKPVPPPQPCGTTDTTPGCAGPTGPTGVTPAPVPPNPVPPNPEPIPPNPVPPNPEPVPPEPEPVPPTPKPVPPTPKPVPPQPKPVPPKPVPPQPEPVPPQPVPPQPVPPEPVPPNPVPPVPGPVPPNPNPVAGSYDAIMKQALDLDKRKVYPQEMQLLNQAIQVNPNRWEAYDLAAQVYLYDYNQFAQGIQYFELSLQHGGNATFHVMHDHSGGTFVTHSEGWLYVSQRGVEYKSWNSTDAFKAPRSEIQEARANRILARIGVQNAGQHSFHIKLTGGRNYNFKGIGQFAEGQRDMILKILAGG
jgi:serine/threonine protein kinase